VLEFHDEYGISQVPMLYAFLACRKVDDKDRHLGKATFFADDGRLKCCLNDPSNLCHLFVTIDSLEDSWEALERALVAPDADWRRSRGRR